MANFTGKVTNNTSHFGCYLKVTESEVSVANNTSKVTVELHITRSNYGWIAGSAQSGNIVIDGTSYSFSYTPNWAYASSGDVVVATKSKVVKHTDDGAKKLRSKCYMEHKWNVFLWYCKCKWYYDTYKNTESKWNSFL